MAETIQIERAQDELVRERLSVERNGYRALEAGSDIGVAARVADILRRASEKLAFELADLSNGPENAKHIGDLPIHLSDALDHFLPADISRVVSAHLKADAQVGREA